MANRNLYDLCSVLERTLAPYFGHLATSVVECPDLCQKPFYLGRCGISGESTVASLGGLEYLLPFADQSKLYDVLDITRYANQCQGMILGGGIGPFQCCNRPCEVSTQLTFTTRGLECNRSLVGYIDEGSGDACCERAQNTLMASSGQVFITEAKPGKVIKIEAQRRCGQKSVFDIIAQGLYDTYSREQYAMALGVVFYIQNSGCTASVLSKIPNEPLHTFPCLKNYQKSFMINGPIVGVGSVVSHDPCRLGLSMTSLYCWNSERVLTGRFENDVCPEKVMYTMYMVPATKLYKGDRPGH